VFPPIGFSVQWDGYDIIWTFDGADGWYPLTSAAQYPGFLDRFDAIAPDETKGFSPPMLAALQEPGMIQIWTGLVARTSPGWSLLVRAPANLPRGGGYDAFEGIIETDRWFGPLIANLRLTKTDVPIDFRPDYPLLQVQPIPRGIYQETHLNNFEIISDLKHLTDRDWNDYHDTVVRPNTQATRSPGQYSVASRKRRSDGTARDDDWAGN